MNKSAQQKAAHVTTRRLLDMKQNGEKISMLTAYDYTMARILDRAGLDFAFNLTVFEDPNRSDLGECQLGDFEIESLLRICERLTVHRYY